MVYFNRTTNLSCILQMYCNYIFFLCQKSFKPTQFELMIIPFMQQREENLILITGVVAVVKFVDTGVGEAVLLLVFCDKHIFGKKRKLNQLKMAKFFQVLISF